MTFIRVAEVKTRSQPEPDVTPELGDGGIKVTPNLCVTEDVCYQFEIDRC